GTTSNVTPADIPLAGLVVQVPAVGRTTISTGTLRVRGDDVELVDVRARGALGETRLAGHLLFVHGTKFGKLHVAAPFELSAVSQKFSGTGTIDSVLDGPMSGSTSSSTVTAANAQLHLG